MTQDTVYKHTFCLSKQTNKKVARAKSSPVLDESPSSEEEKNFLHAHGLCDSVNPGKIPAECLQDDSKSQAL